MLVSLIGYGEVGRILAEDLRAAGLETGGQQIAEETVGAVGRDCRHHHVTFPDLLGRHVHHPVVARVQQHGDCRARHMRAGVDGPHIGFQQADPAHGLVHGGRAETGELVDRAAIGALDISLDDAELVHG